MYASVPSAHPSLWLLIRSLLEIKRLDSGQIYIRPLLGNMLAPMAAIIAAFFAFLDTVLLTLLKHLSFHYFHPLIHHHQLRLELCVRDLGPLQLRLGDGESGLLRLRAGTDIDIGDGKCGHVKGP